MGKKNLRSVGLVKTIFNAIFKTVVTLVCMWNFFLVLAVNTDLALFSQKSDITIQAINNYHTCMKNLIQQKFQKPDINKLMSANVVILNPDSESLGSGVVIQKGNNMYVLTAAHLGKRGELFVVEENNKLYPLNLIRYDERIDLALFEFDKVPASIALSTIANQDVRVGDDVYCVGNPAQLEDAVTKGVVVQKTKRHNYISAPLFMGSSGGGLYNEGGELVGINTSIKITTTGNPTDPSFVVGRSVNLVVIKRFLGL